MSGAQTLDDSTRRLYMYWTSSQVPYAMCAAVISIYGYKTSWNDDAIMVDLMLERIHLATLYTRHLLYLL
jgi:hypothetical protein